MRSRLGRPSPSLVISIVALFVAMGGTSYAAITITGKNVKDGSLTGKDIKKSSLGGANIKDKSLKAADFSGSVKGDTGAKGATGATGATGPQGSQGPQGPQGQAGTSATRLFATVAANGTLVTARSSGATGSTFDGTQSYRVTFNQSLVGCTYTATPSNAGDAPENRQIAIQGDPTNDGGANRGLFIQTAASDGSTASSGFNLIVVCQ